MIARKCGAWQQDARALEYVAGELEVDSELTLETMTHGEALVRVAMEPKVVRRIS